MYIFNSSKWNQFFKRCFVLNYFLKIAEFVIVLQLITKVNFAIENGKLLPALSKYIVDIPLDHTVMFHWVDVLMLDNENISLYSRY